MKLDTMKGLRRTHYCGEVPETEQEVVVCGFADRVRDMGNLIFINLRDRTGLVQLAFNDETDRAVFEKAQLVKSESLFHRFLSSLQCLQWQLCHILLLLKFSFLHLPEQTKIACHNAYHTYPTIHSNPINIIYFILF